MRTLAMATAAAHPPLTISPAQRAQLLGSHRLSLQWISWDQFGTATVVERDGRYWLTGKQRVGRDSVTVEGEITEILPRGFRLDGRVVMDVNSDPSLFGGVPCVKQGPLTFVATGTRQYWRMQEMEGCDGRTVAATSYVDVFFQKR